MSNTEFVEFLKSEDLIIVSKKQLLDLMIEVNVKTAVDKRVKWIDRKTAVAKYGVSNHWLKCAEEDVSSLLKVNKGKGKTSPKKYLESSLIEEQQRQAECY